MPSRPDGSKHLIPKVKFMKDPYILRGGRSDRPFRHKISIKTVVRIATRPSCKPYASRDPGRCRKMLSICEGKEKKKNKKNTECMKKTSSSNI